MTSEAPLDRGGVGVDLNANDFVLFRIDAQFEQDRTVLDERWRELQTQVHPDRFAALGAAAQRVAMQWSIRVNEAYRRLKAPVARAAYLCEINGQPLESESNTAMPMEFLMQQMEWRDALEAATSLTQVQSLAGDVAAHQAQIVGELVIELDQRRDWPAAAKRVRQLMFVDRFARDVDDRIDRLGA
jgi:molecular chaperone HscB